MRLRRLLRSLSVLLMVALLLAVAITVILAFQFPSPRELRKDFGQLRKPAWIRTTNGARPLSDEPAPISTPNRATFDSEAMTSYLIARYAMQSDPQVRVCENLNVSPSSPITDRQSFRASLTSTVHGANRDDPFLESLLAPLGTSLAKPAVGALVTEAQNARASGNTRILQESRYHAQVARASAQLVAAETQLDQISQHAYHLYVIARALQLRPEMAGRDETRELCEAIQSELNEAAEMNRTAEGSPTPGDDGDLENDLKRFKKEKAALLRFLASAELSPAQVNYDPNLSAHTRIDVTPERLIITAPWVTKVLSLKGLAPGTYIPLATFSVPTTGGP